MQPGLACHVTQRGANRQRVFFTGADRTTYLEILKSNLADAEVEVWAWCLMENYVHFVVVPLREDSLSALFRRVHGRYAQYVNARRARSGHLWQNRFFSCALEEQHLWRALAYVERAEAYRWSSAAAHLKGSDRRGLLEWSAWERNGGVEGWRDLLLAPEEALELRLLRRCTYAGRPFGGEEFVAQLEQQFGRRWRRWGFEMERPRAEAQCA